MSQQDTGNKSVKLHFKQYVPDLYDSSLSPIIFLHGVAALHSSWSLVSPRIAKETQRKIYSIDLRNHGQSEWSECNSLADSIADLENFLKQNVITKCILVGHSYGGKIAMALALMKPKLVEQIIVEEATLSNPTAEMKAPIMTLMASAKRISFLPKGLKEKDIRDFLCQIAAERFPGLGDVGYYTPLRRNNDGSFRFDFNIDALERTIRDSSAYAFDFKICQKFQAPTLVLFAENSLMKVEEDSALKEFFPKAKLCKFKTSDHVLHIKRPDEFVEKVSNFINGGGLIY